MTTISGHKAIAHALFTFMPLARCSPGRVRPHDLRRSALRRQLAEVERSLSDLKTLTAQRDSLARFEAILAALEEQAGSD